MPDISKIAHVEGLSGTFVLPAHSAYDRQILRETVETLARRATTLTLGIHGIRWTITRQQPVQLRCAACTRSLGKLSCSRADSNGAMCLECAMQPGQERIARCDS